MCELKMITLVDGLTRKISRAVSKPLAEGRSKSTIATSAASVPAMAPAPARSDCPATWKPCPSTRALRACKTKEWRCTNKIRNGIVPSDETHVQRKRFVSSNINAKSCLLCRCQRLFYWVFVPTSEQNRHIFAAVLIFIRVLPGIQGIRSEFRTKPAGNTLTLSACRQHYNGGVRGRRIAREVADAPTISRPKNTRQGMLSCPVNLSGAASR